MYRITKRDYEDNPDSTFTPLPRNITPLGIELDPTTAVDLSNTDKKWKNYALIIFFYLAYLYDYVNYTHRKINVLS